ANAVVGVQSGEVASQTVVRAPIAARRVPGMVVALTFDDGPDPTYTPQVLAILRQFGVKATFCVIGHAARQHPELLDAIRAQGHMLCDHTETHPYLDRVPADQLGGQISGPVAYCRIVTGQTLTLMRPPYAALNQAAIDTAHQQGLRVLEWSVDPRDFARPPALSIVERVVTKVRAGGVVLMHDGGGDRSNTVVALPAIISQLQSQGYTFTQPRP
ncbi:MAG: polysaccharide deacetylase family protein, partial [Candidatus Dormibacteraeota bacterium]|nr:polysaccharide deacetylase family protein [Candidatus Dormibacteraeota bacterium]